MTQASNISTKAASMAFQLLSWMAELYSTILVKFSLIEFHCSVMVFVGTCDTSQSLGAAWMEQKGEKLHGLTSPTFHSHSQLSRMARRGSMAGMMMAKPGLGRSLLTQMVHFFACPKIQ